MITAQFKPSKHKQGISSNADKDFEGYIEYDGKEYFGAGAVNNLCRDIVNSGCGGSLQIERNGVVAMRVADIYKTSLWAIRECKKSGFIKTRYKEFPKDKFAR